MHPELLPLEELGLIGPAVVVGRESALDSGRVDLVLLGNGGDLALVEFKTGPTPARHHRAGRIARPGPAGPGARRWTMPWTGGSACGPSFATAASSTSPWLSDSRRQCCARSGT